MLAEIKDLMQILIRPITDHDRHQQNMTLTVIYFPQMLITDTVVHFLAALNTITFTFTHMQTR